MVSIDEQGRTVSELSIGESECFDFFSDGSHLVASDGEVFSLPDAKIVWKLDEK